jgi:hypothetical protein
MSERLHQYFRNGDQENNDSNPIEQGLGFLRQGLYFAGVPLAIFSLRKAIYKQNAEIVKKFNERTNLQLNRTERYSDPMLAEGQEYFDETAYPLAKKRYEVDQRLSQLTRDTELIDNLLSNQRADLYGAAQSERTFDQHFKDIAGRGDLLEQAIDKYKEYSKRVRNIEQTLNPELKSKNVSSMQHLLDVTQGEAASETIVSGSTKHIDDYDRRSPVQKLRAMLENEGGYKVHNEVRVDASGKAYLTIENGGRLSSIEIPRMVGEDVLDPFVPQTIQRGATIDNGFKSSLVESRGTFGALRGRITVDTTVGASIAMSGEMNFLIRMLHAIRKTKGNPALLNKEMRIVLNEAITQVGQGLDPTSILFSSEIERAAGTIRRREEQRKQRRQEVFNPVAELEQTRMVADKTSLSPPDIVKLHTIIARGNIYNTSIMYEILEEKADKLGMGWWKKDPESAFSRMARLIETLGAKKDKSNQLSMREKSLATELKKLYYEKASQSGKDAIKRHVFAVQDLSSNSGLGAVQLIGGQRERTLPDMYSELGSPTGRAARPLTEPWKRANVKEFMDFFTASQREIRLNQVGIPKDTWAPFVRVNTDKRYVKPDSVADFRVKFSAAYKKNGTYLMNVQIDLPVAGMQGLDFKVKASEINTIEKIKARLMERVDTLRQRHRRLVYTEGKSLKAQEFAHSVSGIFKDLRQLNALGKKATKSSRAARLAEENGFLTVNSERERIALKVLSHTKNMEELLPAKFISRFWKSEISKLAESSRDLLKKTEIVATFSDITPFMQRLQRLATNSEDYRVQSMSPSSDINMSTRVVYQLYNKERAETLGVVDGGGMIIDSGVPGDPKLTRPGFAKDFRITIAKNEKGEVIGMEFPVQKRGSKNVTYFEAQQAQELYNQMLEFERNTDRELSQAFLTLKDKDNNTITRLQVRRKESGEFLTGRYINDATGKTFDYFEGTALEFSDDHSVSADKSTQIMSKAQIRVVTKRDNLQLPGMYRDPATMDKRHPIAMGSLSEFTRKRSQYATLYFSQMTKTYNDVLANFYERNRSKRSGSKSFFIDPGSTTMQRIHKATLIKTVASFYGIHTGGLSWMNVLEKAKSGIKLSKEERALHKSVLRSAHKLVDETVSKIDISADNGMFRAANVILNGGVQSGRTIYSSYDMPAEITFEQKEWLRDKHRAVNNLSIEEIFDSLDRNHISRFKNIVAAEYILNALLAREKRILPASKREDIKNRRREIRLINEWKEQEQERSVNDLTRIVSSVLVMKRKSQESQALDLEVLQAYGNFSASNFIQPNGRFGGVKFDRRMLAQMAMIYPSMAGSFMSHIVSGNEWVASEYEHMSKYMFYQREVLSQYTPTEFSKLQIKTHNPAIYRSMKQAGFGLLSENNPFLNNQVTLNPSKYIDTTEMVDAQALKESIKFNSLKDALKQASGSMGAGEFDTLIKDIKSGASKLFGVRFADEPTMEMLKEQFQSFAKLKNVAPGTSAEIDLGVLHKNADIVSGVRKNLSISAFAHEQDFRDTIKRRSISGGPSVAMRGLDPSSHTYKYTRLMSYMQGLSFLHAIKKNKVTVDGMDERRVADLEGALKQGMFEDLRMYSEHIQTEQFSPEAINRRNVYKFGIPGLQTTLQSAPESSPYFGQVTMNRETAMDLLLGVENHKLAKRIQKTYNVRRLLKEALIVSEAKITVGSKTQWLATNDLVERMKINLKEKAASVKHENVKVAARSQELLKQLETMSEADLSEVNKLNLSNLHMKRDQVKLLKLLKAAEERINLIQNGKFNHVISMLRHPQHVGLDFRPVSLRIDNTLKYGEALASASDIALVFGDTDKDLGYWLSHGASYLTQDKSTRFTSAMQEIDIFAEYLGNTSVIRHRVNNTVTFAPSNYLSERSMTELLERHGEQGIRLRNAQSMISEQIKNVAKLRGLDPTEVEALQKYAKESLLKKNLLDPEVFQLAGFKPASDSSIRESDAEIFLRTTEPFESENSQNAKIMMYESSLWENGTPGIAIRRTQMLTEAERSKKSYYKKLQKQYAESVNAVLEYSPERETIGGYRKTLNSSVITQKLSAGTVYKDVALSNFVLRDVFEVIKHNPELKSKFEHSLGTKVELNQDTLHRMLDNVVKPLAEEYSLQTKHGAPNLVEALGRFLKEGLDFEDKSPFGKLTPKGRERLGAFATGDMRVTLLPEERVLFSSTANPEFAPRMLAYEQRIQERMRTLNAMVGQITGGKQLLQFGNESIHKSITVDSGVSATITDDINKAISGAKDSGEIRTILRNSLEHIPQTGSRMPKGIRSSIYEFIDKVSQFQKHEVGAAFTAGILNDMTTIQGIHRLRTNMPSTADAEILFRAFEVSKQNSTLNKRYKGYRLGYDLYQGKLNQKQWDSITNDLKDAHIRSAFEEYNVLVGHGLDRTFNQKSPPREFSIYDSIEARPSSMYTNRRGISGNLGAIGKSAAIGTFIAMGINSILSGYSIPDLAEGEGLGGEYWENKATKKSEMMLKPRNPYVQPHNSLARDSRREQAALAMANQTYITLPEHNKEQDYKHGGYGVKIR